MNTDPRLIHIHMRAKLAGHEFAHCNNCTHFSSLAEKWCDKQEVDPTPSLPMRATVCEQHEPAKVKR